MKKTWLKEYVYDLSVNYMLLRFLIYYTFKSIWWKRIIWYKNVGFLKRIFVSAMLFFGCNLSSVNPLEYASMKNQESKVRPDIVNVNSDEPVFFPFSIKTS